MIRGMGLRLRHLIVLKTESVMAVDSPVGFVGMEDIGMTDFVSQLFMDGLGQMGGLAFESHGGGWDKVQAEEMLKDFPHGAPRGRV